ncbi:response regulator transcription factor [Alicyclobacillus acidoterrestris]|uniref:Heme response regulator HssR n=1 Tax=Alicyclobacillus acidoterrestris (strain ATCC 49025 / DSM 3922 / CIP 106132 / NCIMB 13137 / GD3B) TaxID=1356854 RepID=A0A9E7CRI9_ALIAG|nr:response regulator transcription factor [Alicyclobacillus acidoterrestris]
MFHQREGRGLKRNLATILVVDDDAHIRELVGLHLQRDGFDIVEATDGQQALSLLETTKVDLVVLDIMMPNIDGWALCRAIREDSSIPVLMLTALGETQQKVKGLQLGADDYLVKPFDPAELVARVHALLRRYRISTEHVVEAGELRLDGTTRDVVFRGQHLVLPPKEFELLFKLASYPGRTLSRDQLIEDIWGYDFDGDERTVDVHIKRLRDKFPEDECSFKIRTVRGLGYRFEVDE